MEIIKTTSFQENMPEEQVKIFYLYMTKDARMKPQIYFSFTGDQTTEACKYLGSFNMPMECMQIRGTQSEALKYREDLENKRKIEFDEFLKKEQK